MKEGDKNNKSKTDNKEGYIILALIIIIVGMWWFYSSNNEKTEEYSGCVTDCIEELDSCLQDYIIFDKNNNEYIPQEDYQFCFDFLESCAEDCKG